MDYPTLYETWKREKWSKKLQLVDKHLYTELSEYVKAVREQVQIFDPNAFNARLFRIEKMNIENDGTLNLNYRSLTVNNVIVTGDNNDIIGNNNKIVGDFNRVTGNNNKIFGDSNQILGNNNISKGKYNMFVGGNNNQIEQEINRRNEETNKLIKNKFDQLVEESQQLDESIKQMVQMGSRLSDLFSLRGDSFQDVIGTQIFSNCRVQFGQGDLMEEDIETTPKFSKLEKTEEENIQCNICMENKKNAVLKPCGHTYCVACAKKLKECAVCRKKIKKIEAFFI